MSAADDELLRPTLGDHGPASSVDDAGRRPWRLGSQVYVAILGGVVAVTAIAVLNAHRLGMTSAQKRTIAGIGVAGLAAVLVFAALVPADTETRLVRIGSQVISVLAWGGMFLVQRSPDRRHHFYSGNVDEDDDYGSLLGPGLLACVAGGIVLAVVVTAVRG